MHYISNFRGQFQWLLGKKNKLNSSGLLLKIAFVGTNVLNLPLWTDNGRSPGTIIVTIRIIPVAALFS
jgi:hypothetical protein